MLSKKRSYRNIRWLNLMYALISSVVTLPCLGAAMDKIFYNIPAQPLQTILDALPYSLFLSFPLLSLLSLGSDEAMLRRRRTTTEHNVEWILPDSPESLSATEDVSTAIHDALRQDIANWDTGSEDALRICVMVKLLIMATTPLAVCVFGLEGFLMEAVGWMIVYALSSPLKQCQALRCIALHNGPYVIRPLLEAVVHRSPRVCAEAVVALARQLPTMHDEIAVRITDRHQRAVRRCLLSKDPTVAVAALEIVGEYEDMEAMSLVQRVLSGRCYEMRSEAVQAAAATCEARLRNRMDREQARTDLLRATSERSLQFQPSGRDLVRPAQASTNVIPGELLRPESGEQVSPTDIVSVVAKNE